MSVLRSEVRAGAYADSIVLMRLQSAVAGLPGIEDAGVVMGTAANKELLRASELLPETAADAGADDLVLVVRAVDEGAGDAALEQVDALLARRSAAVDDEFRPRSLESAVKLLPAARWVSISVPGRYRGAGGAAGARTWQERLSLQRQRVASRRDRPQEEGRGRRSAGDGPGLRHRHRRRRAGWASPTACGAAPWG